MFMSVSSVWCILSNVSYDSGNGLGNFKCNPLISSSKDT